MILNPTDRLYLQSDCFVERPHNLDGRVARVGLSMLWFTAWRVIWRGAAGGKRTGEALVPVEAIDSWLASQSDPVREHAARQIANVSAPRTPLTLGERKIRLDEPRVIGILNLTPDSFSDGGRFHDDAQAAAEAGFEMAQAGAAIVDIGGESTRPGAKLVWEGDEIGRVVPVIEKLARGGTAVSIDTRKAGVMEAALAAGATLVNDISALLYDDRALEVVAKAGCPVVLMHAPSQTSDPHAVATYDDVLLDVFDWLDARIEAVVEAGVDRSRIIVDPGIGFGKSVQQNLALTNGIAMLHALGGPILYGASRKRMIGAIDNEAPADARLGGSIALHLIAAQAGVQLIRAHDVGETVQALKTWRALRDVALVVG